MACVTLGANGMINMIALLQRGELGDSLFIDTADGSGARTTAVYDIQAEGSATTFVA